MQRRLKSISRIDLERDLRHAGIREGDVLVVHSALSQVGWVLGGPFEAISAFRNVLGPSGTLVMPTFTFNLKVWKMPPFDPAQTASRVGVLTDAFWQSEGVLRSSHPTHSVAASGPLAADIVVGPIDYEPLGLSSPLDRARALGAKILLMGVGQNRNSTVHVAESHAAVPYFAVRFSPHDPYDEGWYMDANGRRHLVLIEEMPGSSEGFDVLEKPLREQGIVSDVQIGSAASQIMDANSLCRAVTVMLRRDPLLLLSEDSPSEITLRRRLYTEKLLREKRLTTLTG